LSLNPRSGDIYLFINKNRDKAKFLHWNDALPFESHPDEKFVYGYSTDILGAQIEEITGKPLGNFLKEKIFDPLEMEDTHFFLPKEKTSRLTTVYSASDNGLEKAPKEGGMVSQGAYLNDSGVCFSGGAGLLSTAVYYAKIMQMLPNGGTYNGKRIISRKTIEIMTIDHFGEIEFPWELGTGFGLGFAVVKDLADRGELGSEGMYGWGGAYHSVYWIDPKEKLIFLSLSQLLLANGLDDHKNAKGPCLSSINRLIYMQKNTCNRLKVF